MTQNAANNKVAVKGQEYEAPDVCSTDAHIYLHRSTRGDDYFQLTCDNQTRTMASQRFTNATLLMDTFHEF